MKRLAIPAILFAALPALHSCVHERYDNVSPDNATVGVELSIMTRAITSDTHTYEVGTQWENYIDIAGGDYRIYFFTNDKDDAAATSDSERNTLIAEFVPTEMTAVEGSTYTQYTLAGEVGEDIVAYSGFKVVVLANWGAYPSVIAGTTTIDALVEGENTTFTAETFLTGVDETHLIPFYGVREYSNVEWKQGGRTTLEEDFTSSPHLVGDANDSGASSRTYPFTRQGTTSAGDVWGIYLPEYANISDADTAAEDYSHIQVTIEDTAYEIYFANYSDGVAANTADYDIFRNCLYRVTIKIDDLIDDMLPSANCIVCLSGETTAFWPYYRIETGGGYKFEDYLDAYSEDESKKISYVRIIWQRAGNVTSSSGFLGDNSDGSKVWIDDLGDVKDEFHRKIYVKVPEGDRGNALIAAYNTDGEVVWSWHIWSRAPENDPRTVNTKLYYTYEWDENGIYCRESGRPRVAGYTIMNCSLGAMADEPTVYGGWAGQEKYVTSTSSTLNTYGTVYQWGRKDPFPPYEYRSYNTSSNYANTYLNSYNRCTYYNNSNSSLTRGGISNKALSDFSGDYESALDYSIKNPTTMIHPYTSSYSSALNTFFVASQTALEENYIEPYDGNWLPDSDGEHYNRLWGGLDPEHDDVTKAYDTGLKANRYDLFGDYTIHLFDDYGEKSIFDPCPYGWRVSPPDLWIGFTHDGLNPQDGEDFMEVVNADPDRSDYYGITLYLQDWKSGETTYFPCQGLVAPNRSAVNFSRCGNYHNATADVADRVNIMHIHSSCFDFNIFENNCFGYTIKSSLSPLRCVRIDSVVQ